MFFLQIYQQPCNKKSRKETETKLKRILKENFQPYCKTWIVLLTPIILLPLCVIINTPVGLEFYLRLNNSTKIYLSNIDKLGIKYCLCDTTHVGLLGVVSFAFCSDKSLADCPFSAYGRYGDERGLLAVFQRVQRRLLLWRRFSPWCRTK